MMQTIPTKDGDYSFESVHLYHGRKKIAKDIARENLIILREELIKTDIKWGLIFGTLLGAIREQDFIDHDEDTDVYVFHEHKKKLFNMFSELKENGFEVVRYQGYLLSIMRKNEYIDFYFFKRKLFGRRAGELYVPRRYFSSTEIITFHGHSFPTLNEPRNFLCYTYGPDWDVPRTDSHAQGNPPLWKMILRKRFPLSIKVYRFFKKTEKD